MSYLDIAITAVFAVLCGLAAMKPRRLESAASARRVMTEAQQLQTLRRLTGRDR